MSLVVKLIEITELKGRADRFARIIFRGVPKDSQIVRGSKGDILFNETFSWPLSSVIIPEEFLEVQLYHKNKVFNDRLVASYRCFLEDVIQGGSIELTDKLLDSENIMLHSNISLEIEYFIPKGNPQVDVSLDIVDDESDEDRGSPALLRGELSGSQLTLSTIVGQSRPPSVVMNSRPVSTPPDGVELRNEKLAEKEAFHPKIRLPKTVITKYKEWQVQVRVIEGKDLSGMTIDPLVDIVLGEQKKHTTVKQQNCNPFWDEFFVFEFKAPKEQLLDQVLYFQAGNTLSNFLAQQQQQNQTIKNISSTSRLPEFYQKDAQFFIKVAHPSVSLPSCTGMSLKMIKTKKDVVDCTQGSSGGSDFDNVFTNRSLVSSGQLIGQFKDVNFQHSNTIKELDLWTVYGQPDHCYFGKWAVLLDGKTTEVKGFLRVDVTVFGKGDPIKEPPPRREEDVVRNLLLPEGIQAVRSVNKYVVKVYRAEGIPRMNSSIMANVKKAFTGKVKDLADPFVEVTFAGCKGRTKVVKNCYDPEFNQELIFTEFLPPMCRRIKIQLRDSDAVSNEPIGTHYIDLNEISDIGQGSNDGGFMPTFGPCWVHLYGSTRDYTFFDDHMSLNEGIGEGICYRGRVLIAIDCFESEPCETGTVHVQDIKESHSEGKVETKLANHDSFQLFAAFYEASMIERKLGEKSIQFEVSIGEYGLHVDNSPHKETKPVRDNRSEEEFPLFGQGDGTDGDHEGVCIHSVTPPMRPVCPERRYYHVPWNEVKPCVHIRFPFEDQKVRHYRTNMLQKFYNKLEDNIDELQERVRLGLSGTNHLMKRVLEELIHGCSMLTQLADDRRKSVRGQINNDLDKERLNMRFDGVKHLSDDAYGIIENCKKSTELDKNLESMKKLLKKIDLLLIEPQHGLPDVFVWMISGGKRIAYARIPAANVLYSPLELEKGLNCGRVQTVFLKRPEKRGQKESSWTVQAKLDVLLWLGLANPKHKQDMLKDAPVGFEVPEDCLPPFINIPQFLQYQEKQKFILRAHLYQARSLFGSDETGLSDAFARVIGGHNVKETQVILQTRSPTWDQMLKFKEVVLWGEAAEIYVNPPIIVVEIYDKDPGGEIEFIGRVLAKPVVKLAEEPYGRPLFPPVLQWFPVLRGDEKAGDLLAAFELLQVVGDGVAVDLPPDPAKKKQGIYPVPDGIRPKTEPHRVEVLFWGVREMKRAKLLQVTRPRVDLDCCYKVKKVDIKTLQTESTEEQYVRSSTCKNAFINPNFEDPIVMFDVNLPDNERYTPPLTIRVNDCRAFGRFTLAGSHVINSLRPYVQDPQMYKELFSKRSNSDLEGRSRKPVSYDLPSQNIEMQISQVDSADGKTNENKKDTKGKKTRKDEEVLDWWTRFHVTLRDAEGANLHDNQNLVTPDKSKDNKIVIPRIKIYSKELEKVEEFGGFTDFLDTFVLTKGKRSTDDGEDEARRFRGKFKGCIRVWKYPLPENFKCTFHKLPSREPVKILVRVYCIRALNLKPADPNGKADPYLKIIMGRKKVNDQEHYVSKQLNPEFGRMFEFEAQLPFDNLLTVQVKDWDFASADDFLGETKIDIENRFYSKHRPTCGIQDVYIPHGFAKWRDALRPTEVLAKVCKESGLTGPLYNNGLCVVEDQEFRADEKYIVDERGNKKLSNEPAALLALKNFHKITNKGFHLVPEHVETRSLYNPDKPGIEQGKIQMWVDIFSLEGPGPGAPVDIAPRKPDEYELRVIVWNTEHIPATETNIVTGVRSSDIYVKGWLEGIQEQAQRTDVHYRSSDGSGMFNWRFVFPFMFHKAEEKLVTRRKASIFSIDETEEKHQPNLYLQVYDADVLSSDDIIGDLILNLIKIPFPRRNAGDCKLTMLEEGQPSTSIFKCRTMRGWWPFQINLEDDNDPKPVPRGEVELQLDLLTKEEAEETPAGKQREEPQPLPKPNRPADSLNLFMSPLRMLQLLFVNRKMCLIKFAVISLLILIVALFFYSMPGYTVKKIFNA